MIKQILITSESVFMQLSKSILHKRHTSYIDNWYSPPKLFLTLIKNETNAIGNNDMIQYVLKEKKILYLTVVNAL